MTPLWTLKLDITQSYFTKLQMEKSAICDLLILPTFSHERSIPFGLGGILFYGDYFKMQMSLERVVIIMFLFVSTQFSDI